MSPNFAERLAELPAFLSNHLKITVIALAVGVLVSVPLAVALARRARLRYPVLTASGVVQTIPSLALLALMVPALAAISYTTGYLYLKFTGQEIPDDPIKVYAFPAFGFWPAIIGLTAYSILPILRNTVTGILGVDPAMTEAARGMGMTEWQVLRKVQLPLAAPIIIAGIRTSTVWVVGIATLATPVGQKCLGNYIFAGLQTANWTMVMFGVVAAALLAVGLDLLIAGLERAARDRRRTLGTTCGLALTLIVFTGLLAPTVVRMMREPAVPVAITKTDEGEADEGVTVIRIGAKTFTEQYILAAMVGQRLEAAGFQPQRTESLGSTIVFNALANGDLDVYVDYSGTIWANYMDRSEAAAPWRVLAEMSGWLAAEYNIRALGSLGFENAYMLAMRREQADELGIRSIADLAAHAPDLAIGGDYEFFGRPEWEQIRDTYGLQFAERTSYDSSMMYAAVAQGQVDAIAGFSSDGRIARYDLVTLTDPQGVIPPYDAVVLVGPTVAADERLTEALRPLIGAIPVDLMRQANLMVDRSEDKKTAGEAAAWLLEQIGD